MATTKKMIKPKKSPTTARKIASVITFFFVGLYGGFIQVGIGFLMIAGLSVIFGMSLVKVNAIKLFVAAIYIIASLGVFVYNDEVNWVLGLTLAIGNGIGAWVGSQFAMSKGDKWIRIVLVFSVIIMAVKLSGVFDMVF